MGFLGRAASVTLRVAGLFALVDVWQVAIVAPGSLEPRMLAWLLALWGGSVFLGALVLLPAVEWRWHAGVERRTTAILVGVGTWLLAQEAGLQALQPLSPWRLPVVLGTLALGAGVGAVVWRLPRHRRAWTLAVGSLALALGMVGAVRGFTVGTDEDEASRRAPAIDAPNVLVLLIDTLRADHLGCYGYERPTSPNIDRLASEGTLFLEARSQSTWTKPSTASLFTGRYPSQHQAYLERSRLPESELLLPEALAQLGYRTAVFSGNPWVTPEWGFDQGVEHFHSVYDERFARVTLYMRTLKRVDKALEHKRRVYNLVKSRVQHAPSTTARDTGLADALLRWLDGIDRQRPFFAHVQLMSPHHPYDPPPPYDRFVPDRTHAPVTAYPRKSYFFFDEGEPLAPAALADMIARYDGDIRYVDDVVGRILAGLDARGLRDRTLVVLTSDHGEEFYDHRNWGHGQSVYEELTHVPLILRYPRVFPSGRRDARPVMSVDLMPTVLQLAGAAPLPSLAGHSLVPLDAPRPPEDAYVELLYRYGWARALVQGDRKVVRMVRGDDDRTEVFDLARDPHEQAPLPGADARLAGRLDEIERWAAAHQSAPAKDVEIDGEMAGRLKALGYLE